MSPSGKNTVNAVIVALLLAFVIACSCPNVRERGVVESEPDSIDTVEAKDDAQKKQNKDEGDFLVKHTNVKNPKFEKIDSQFRENKVLEKAADKLNRVLILPYDITLQTKDCDQTNAYYNPSDRSITFCYELMEYFFQLYKLDGDSDREANGRMNKAITFVFLHELGHALIDSYELPITGNEEDAADRCSAFICIEELGDDGVDSIVAAAEAFAIESKLSRPTKRSMADEHLLKEQRFFNSLCMIYGSDPEKYSRFTKNNLLPEARASRCPSEYDRMSKSWQELLEPWRKD